MAPNTKVIWATLITNQSYLPGVEALAKSLRSVSSQYSLLVLVTPSFPEKYVTHLLSNHDNIRIHAIQPLYPLNTPKINYAFPQFVEAWTKLRVWELVEYDVVGLLDSDMILLKNMDFVLEQGVNYLMDHTSGIRLLASHACVCNIMNNPKYPKWWQPSNCAYHRCDDIGIAPEAIQKYKESDIADPFSRLVAGRYFNTGLIVLRPDANDMQEFINQVELRTDLDGYQFPEQDLLNEYFANEWKPLPLSTNALKTIGKGHPKLMQLDKVHNLHFIMDKPWNLERNSEAFNQHEFKQLNEIWWKTYELNV